MANSDMFTDDAPPDLSAPPNSPERSARSFAGKRPFPQRRGLSGRVARLQAWKKPLLVRIERIIIFVVELLAAGLTGDLAELQVCGQLELGSTSFAKASVANRGRIRPLVALARRDDGLDDGSQAIGVVGHEEASFLTSTRRPGAYAPGGDR